MATHAFESITVADTAIGFTTATRDDAVEAFVTVESAAVRFRTDGTDPTAAIGHVLEVGDTLKLKGRDDLQKVKFIRRDGVSATLRVTYLV